MGFGIWDLGFGIMNEELFKMIWDLGFGIMNEELFKKRTKQLALRIIKLVNSLPETTTTQVIRKQLLRSGTSVGANYRAACRAKSLRFWILNCGFWIFPSLKEGACRFWIYDFRLMIYDL